MAPRCEMRSSRASTQPKAASGRGASCRCVRVCVCVCLCLCVCVYRVQRVQVRVQGAACWCPVGLFLADQGCSSLWFSIPHGLPQPHNPRWHCIANPISTAQNPREAVAIASSQSPAWRLVRKQHLMCRLIPSSGLPFRPQPAPAQPRVQTTHGKQREGSNGNGCLLRPTAASSGAALNHDSAHTQPQSIHPPFPPAQVHTCKLLAACYRDAGRAAEAAVIESDLAKKSEEVCSAAQLALSKVRRRDSCEFFEFEFERTRAVFLPLC